MLNRRLTALACVAGLVGTVAAQAATPVKKTPAPKPAASAPPAHNFIKMDEDFGEPSYWDSASVRRVPGGFAFRILDVSTSYRMTFVSQTETQTSSTRVARWTSVEISCQWRTLRAGLSRRSFDLASTTAPAPTFDPPDATSFMRGKSRYTPIADQLCSGVTPAKGLPSEAAIAATFQPVQTSRNALAPPPDVLPPPPLPIGPSRTHSPNRPAWMEGVHGYAPVTVPTNDGTRLFLDHPGLNRRDDTADGLSLVVLDLAPPNLSLSSQTAAVRRVRYDCAGKTLTVRGQAIWDGYGVMTQVDETVSPPRNEAQSPAIAAEIAAACQSGAAQTGPGQPTVEATITAVRAARPPRQPGWNASCLWKSLTTDQRVARFNLWKDRNVIIVGERLDPGLEPVWTACGVPASDRDDANRALRQKAIQHGAVQRLMNRYGILIETRILTAWRALPEDSRRRFAQPFNQATEEERVFQVAVAQKLARPLQLKSGEDLSLVADYLKCQGVLDFELELPPEPTVGPTVGPT